LIKRYQKKRESFSLSAASFESGAMQFSGGKSLRCWSQSKNLFHPCPSVKRNSKQQTQNLSKWLKMPLLRQKDNKLP